jgi:hypothetical protein
VSQRKRERKFAAEVAARIDAQSAAIPALDQCAAVNRWTPVPNPGLSEEDIGSVCRVAMGTKSVLDTDKSRRQRFRTRFLETSHTGPVIPYVQARLLHCYQGGAETRDFIVGNACFDIDTIRPPAGFMGSVAAPEDLSVAFCAVPLTVTLPWVQLIRSLKSWIPGGDSGLGYPDLDAHYTAFCSSREQARRIIDAEVASLVATRDDWGLSVIRSSVLLVAFEPLSTGIDSQELVAAAIRIADRMPE